MLKYILIILLILSGTINAQSDIIDKYVQQGLENNLALKQQNITLQQSLQALNQARGMFLPSVSIEARYSRAGGGRIIEFPVGDLMNPVYGTLNDLLAAIGQQPQFPTNLSNERIPFLREEEQETKVRVVQPIFQLAIYFNYKIKSNLAKVEQAATSAFERQLTADIKKAYFNYLKTVQVVDLLEKTKLLLNENFRVSEKLFQNGKATEEVVFRARAEISDWEQKHAEAQKNNKLGAAYFDFLLNLPFDSPIKIIDDAKLSFNNDINLEDAQIQALQQREEFSQLQNAISIANSSMSLNKSSFLPGVTGVLDYGYQGEKYNFTEKDDYWIASVVLSWNLFNGFQDKSKYKQATLNKKKLEIQFLELESKIKLQVQEAVDNLIVARKTITSANERLNSAKKSFKIVNKKYEQGMASQIEYIDARTTFTNAAINQIIVSYDYFIKYAEFERVVAY